MDFKNRVMRENEDKFLQSIYLYNCIFSIDIKWISIAVLLLQLPVKALR